MWINRGTNDTCIVPFPKRGSGVSGVDTLKFSKTCWPQWFHFVQEPVTSNSLVLSGWGRDNRWGRSLSPNRDYTTSGTHHWPVVPGPIVNKINNKEWRRSWWFQISSKVGGLGIWTGTEQLGWYDEIVFTKINELTLMSFLLHSSHTPTLVTNWFPGSNEDRIPVSVITTDVDGVAS